MEETGTDFLKIGLILASFPLWGPFAKALFEELELALRPEGGLFGAKPSPIQKKAIEAELSAEPISQVHEPKAHRANPVGIAPSPTGRGQRPAPLRQPQSLGPQAGGQPRAFRSRTPSPSPSNRAPVRRSFR